MAPKTTVQSPTPDKARKSLCEHYASVLAGRSSDPKLLDSNEFVAFAQRARDLVSCGAIKAGTPASCSLLGSLSPEAGKFSSDVKECLSVVTTMQEARDFPKGHSYLFEMYEECRHSDKKEICDAFRDALRNNNSAKCSDFGDLAPTCRAFISLDKTNCVGVDSGAKKFEADCKLGIDRKAFLSQGLKGAAKSAVPRERDFAQAALGEKNACESIVRSAVEICMAGAPPPTIPGPTAPAPPSQNGPASTESGSPPATPVGP